MAQESLHPADVVVLLQAHRTRQWTYASLGQDLFVSPSRVHDSLRRAARAHLFDPVDRQVVVRNLEEFLVHGARYAYPAVVGEVGVGVLIGADRFGVSASDRLVWAHPGKSSIKGRPIVPLHPKVPEIALRDEGMHELLALVDSLRLCEHGKDGIAARALKERLRSRG